MKGFDLNNIIHLKYLSSSVFLFKHFPVICNVIIYVMKLVNRHSAIKGPKFKMKNFNECLLGDFNVP